jgi:Mn2+/Fe2+ NRAMP family transporter
VPTTPGQIRPSIGQMTRDFFIPNWAAHSKQSAVMLLVICVVGTSAAPGQLFSQQSYIVDRRITSRYMKYEKVCWMWTSLALIAVVIYLDKRASA